MKLTHFRSPFFDMEDFLTGKEVERFEHRNTNPDVNIIENEKNYEIEIAAPGLNKDDFKINLNENVLTISSKFSEEYSDADESKKEKKNDETTKRNYTYREFCYGSFSRSFTLPKTIDIENINAKYDQGILHISLPLKKEEAKFLKEITVK